MLELREFVAEDAEAICPDAVDENLRADEAYWRKWAKIYAGTGPGYTAFCEGRAIGAAGIRLLDDGTGQPWLMMTREATRHKTDVLRSLKIMLGILIKEYRLKKLVTHSRKGFAASQGFLEHLGFKRMADETTDNYFYCLEF